MILKPTIEKYKQSADYIKSRLMAVPDIAVILGSGLSSVVECVTDRITIPYSEIPNFPVSTVSYQKGELVAGKLSGKNVLLMNGRFHTYEGYEMWQTAYPVGVFKLLGIEKLIITNAAGGINDNFAPGDLMIITDHIKLDADSPLRGANISELGTRFFDVQSVHDVEMRNVALAAAKELGFELKTGIYAFMGGPQYESPAEIRMLKLIGADAVGMSTVPEIIASAHVGMRLLAISCISNMAAGITGAPITEEEVLDTGAKMSSRFCSLISNIVKELQ
jgi:purine-nucleoside phosphorylase